jgi:tRNA nucleotidyltransferase/poly(A) polymerase
MFKAAVETIKKELPPKHKAVVDKIKETAKELGIKAYIAGGYVRDLILDKPSEDIDIMCERDAVKLVQALVKKHALSTPVTYGRSQAIAVVLDGYPIDFIDAEKVISPVGGTLEGREEFGVAFDDIFRRDLTINTLLYDLDDDVIKDISGKGLADIKEGIIRTVVDPNIKYRVHPADIVRAIRFAAVYNFKIAESIFEAMKKYKEGLRPRDKGGDISNRRIRRELRKMVVNDEIWDRGLEIMKAVGLIGIIGDDIQDVMEDRENWYKKELKKKEGMQKNAQTKEEYTDEVWASHLETYIIYIVKALKQEAEKEFMPRTTSELIKEAYQQWLDLEVTPELKVDTERLERIRNMVTEKGKVDLTNIEEPYYVLEEKEEPTLTEEESFFAGDIEKMAEGLEAFIDEYIKIQKQGIPLEGTVTDIYGEGWIGEGKVTDEMLIKEAYENWLKYAAPKSIVNNLEILESIKSVVTKRGKYKLSEETKIDPDIEQMLGEIGASTKSKMRRISKHVQ